MKLTASIRSTETWTGEGSGQIVEEARAVATAGIPSGFELQTVTTLSAKPGEPVTMRALARRTETKTIEAEGDDYPQAYAALRATVPDGWQLQLHVIVDD